MGVRRFGASGLGEWELRYNILRVRRYSKFRILGM
jgi:hypothetical protein